MRIVSKRIVSTTFVTLCVAAFAFTLAAQQPAQQKLTPLTLDAYSKMIAASFSILKFVWVSASLAKGRRLEKSLAR